MEDRGVYSPPQQPAAYDRNQPTHGEENYDPTPYDPPPLGAAPSDATPARIAVHVDASSLPANSVQPPIQNVPAAEGWFARNRRNKPQANSAGSASLILVSGGMNLAWSCNFNQAQGFNTDTHILICWYIWTILGVLVSAFITNRMTKKPIYLFASFLVVLDGILFLALSHEYRAILTARYLNGFAVGLVFVPLLVLIGEEVNSNQRGMLASLFETGSFTIGIFLQILFAYAYNPESSANKLNSTKLHGVVVIIYGILAFAMSYFLVIESPVYHLLHGDDDQAIDCLRRLHRPHVLTNEIYQKLEELKRYIEYNEHNNNLMIPALLKLCFYRGLIALSFSPLIHVGLFLSTTSSTDNEPWSFVIFGLCLWLGSYISAFLMDYIGRKRFMLLGAFVCACIAIGVGAVFHDLLNILDSSKMGAVMYALFVLAIFAGIFNNSTSVYLTEAFPLHRKTYYMAISFIVELLVLLIIGACEYDDNSLGSYFITFGVFYVFAFMLGVIFLPETKKLTLQEAQEKFQTIVHRWNE